MISTSSTASATEPSPSLGADLKIAGPVLLVTDLERALRFYVGGLGMKVAGRLAGNPGPGATVVGAGEARLPFILLRQRDREVQPRPPIAIGDGLSRTMLVVSDAKAIATRLTEQGYKPSVPNARNIFFVKDPDGYSYEVMQIADPK